MKRQRLKIKILNRLNNRRPDFTMPIRRCQSRSAVARLPACLRPERTNQRCRQLVRLKSKRARLALVSNAALRVDQIDAIRPASVRTFGRIAELVEHSRKFDAKFPHASPGDECSFFFCLRAGKNDLVFDIALHLPHVAGMRLCNVDNQECHALAILLVKLVEGRNLPPKRRSRVAAEYQHHWLPLV